MAQAATAKTKKGKQSHQGCQHRQLRICRHTGARHDRPGRAVRCLAAAEYRPGVVQPKRSARRRHLRARTHGHQLGRPDRCVDERPQPAPDGAGYLGAVAGWQRAAGSSSDRQAHQPIVAAPCRSGVECCGPERHAAYRAAPLDSGSQLANPPARRLATCFFVPSKWSHASACSAASSCSAVPPSSVPSWPRINCCWHSGKPCAPKPKQAPKLLVKKPKTASPCRS